VKKCGWRVGLAQKVSGGLLLADGVLPCLECCFARYFAKCDYMATPEARLKRRVL